MSPNSPPQDRLLRVRGTVQGVGFRPFVHRLATELGVRGWVRNDAQGVLLRAVGEAALLDELAARVRHRAPAAARVVGADWVVDAAEPPAPERGFLIHESQVASGEIETTIPIDLAPCPDCRRELQDPQDRRNGYAFINCTQCGPRYSLIESLPYDRPRTTMRRFQLCAKCETEYRSPTDRRFHAEPNACPRCGPQVRLMRVNGETVADGAAAVRAAAEALCQGRIVAVKGVGGFHLLVDATDPDAVAVLRRRKHREEKPFAVMFRDLQMLEDWVEVTPEARVWLQSPAAPIVLLPAKKTRPLAAGVAPGNPLVGAMLPSSPLHLLLLASLDRPVVATSANLAEEPLCTDDAEARTRLADIADLLLGHDRPIARSVDDSVVRLTRTAQPIVLRRARGFAPTELTLPARLPRPLLCAGAQMKSTLAVAIGERVVLSPHLGDLGGAATHRLYRQTAETLGALVATKFAGVVCDKHPDYTSTRFAEASGLPCLPVQHHLAHILAVLLEHRQIADDVLGVAWDGTGYGEDGTIWGGEFILLRGGRAARFARLRPFRLPGGEAAVRDARRVALALAHDLGETATGRVAARGGLSPVETGTLRTLLERGLHAPVCSSVGRLFDGVGALLGLGRRNAYEGQVPLAVELAALRASPAAVSLPFAVQWHEADGLWEMDWRPAVRALIEQPDADPAAQAAAFHRGLAAVLVEVVCRSGASTVALAGGCFQNALLRTLSEEALVAAGRRVLAARDLPPNDGSIAAGQALAALWNLTTVEPGLRVRPTPASTLP
jgi:hydrogenase maturation protein HypF